MFYTWGVSGHPHLYTPYVCTPPYICMPPGVYTPPYAPIFSYASVFFGGFACCGGYNGLLFVLGHPPLHHPCLGVPPLYYIPTHSCWFPVHQYVSGISVCYVGISLLPGRVWGCFPISWGWGHQHLRCPYAHSCTFL